MTIQAGFDGTMYLGAEDGGEAAATAVGKAQDVTLNLSKEEYDASAREDMPWKNFIPGQREWTIDFTMLYDELNTPHDTLEAAFYADTVISVKLVDVDGEGGYGNVLVITFPHDWPMGDAAKRTITLRGKGAWNRLPAAS